MAPLTLHWLHVVALLGAIQGVLLAGVLASRRRNRTANLLLAALMLAFSLFLATGVYHAGGFLPRFPHFFGVGYPLPFLFGPLLYLYAVTAADRSRRLHPRDALHFLPFLTVVLVGLHIYMMSGPDKIAFAARLETEGQPAWMEATDLLKLVSGVAYAVLTLAFLLRHRERVKDSYSSLARVDLAWLLWLGGAAAAIWLLAVAFQVLESSGVASLTRGDDAIALAIAALVYAIGYRGLRQPEVFRFETAEFQVPAELRARAPVATPVEAPFPAAPVADADAGIAAEPSDAAPRYERSGLSDRQAERLREALLSLMDRERPWRDSELTLADLAGRLSTSPHKLSEVLNAQVGQPFYDFVNGYRVREVQRRIAAGDAERLTMLTLALEAGFASKSTFNLVFKKHTSLTPSDFRRQAAGN